MMIMIMMKMMTIIIIIIIIIIIAQGDKVTILWNQQVQTDRTIPNKKPDIIMKREHVC